jgi:membrane protein DedA with SNARE-associated domain
MSAIKPLQYLFYTIISGFIWASTVCTTGYLIGRFLDIQSSAFEENILVIVLAFACFGLLMGFIVKQVTFRKISTSA